MINLIPPEAKKIVKREYIFRVGGTLSFLIGGIFLVLTIALVPTYVLIGAQINNSLNQANDEGEDEAFTRADIEVQMTKDILNQLKRNPVILEASKVIEEVQSLAPSGIAFKVFIVDDTSGKIQKLQVQGTASTREALASLKSAIEASDTFDTAEVPISDLARDINLPFTVTITPTEEK